MLSKDCKYAQVIFTREEFEDISKYCYKNKISISKFLHSCITEYLTILSHKEYDDIKRFINFCKEYKSKNNHYKTFEV